MKWNRFIILIIYLWIKVENHCHAQLSCYNRGELIEANYTTGERERCLCKNRYGIAPVRDLYGPRCELLKMSVNKEENSVHISANISAEVEFIISFQVFINYQDYQKFQVLCWNTVGKNRDCGFLFINLNEFRFQSTTLTLHKPYSDNWYEYRIKINRKTAEIVVNKRYSGTVHAKENYDPAAGQIILGSEEGQACYREMRINNELIDFPEKKNFPCETLQKLCAKNQSIDSLQCRNGRCYTYHQMEGGNAYCFCDNNDVRQDKECVFQNESIISLVSSNCSAYGQLKLALPINFVQLQSEMYTEKFDFQFRTSWSNSGILLIYRNTQFDTVIRIEDGGYLSISGNSYRNLQLINSASNISDSLWHLLVLEFYGIKKSTGDIKQKNSYYVDVSLDEVNVMTYELKDYTIDDGSMRMIYFGGENNTESDEVINNTCFKNVRINERRVEIYRNNRSECDIALCTKYSCHDSCQLANETCQGVWPRRYCRPKAFEIKPAIMVINLTFAHILGITIGVLLFLMLVILIVLIICCCCPVFKKKSHVHDDILKVHENKIEYNSSDAKEEDFKGRIDFDLLNYHCGRPVNESISQIWLNPPPPPPYQRFDPTRIVNRITADGSPAVEEDVLEYEYEGDNRQRDSVSTIFSSVATTDNYSNFNHLRSWGPKFNKLSHLYIPE